MKIVFLKVADDADTAALKPGATTTVGDLSATVIGEANLVINPTASTLVPHTHEVAGAVQGVTGQPVM